MADTLDPALPVALQDQAQRVLDLACDSDTYLATAESCTGGLLAALLTDVPGCSHVFERGFVVYSDDAKCDLLDIERSKVDDCGAVSEVVARAMALGALRRSRAHVAVSITGFAGPPGSGACGEEGLVHFATARHAVRERREGDERGGDEVVNHREEHFGAIGRDGVRIEALRVALEMIEEAMRA